MRGVILVVDVGRDVVIWMGGSFLINEVVVERCCMDVVGLIVVVEVIVGLKFVVEVIVGLKVVVDLVVVLVINN